MSALALGLQMTEMTSTRMHNSRLLNHETVLHELADILSRVGIADLIDFIGVQPDLSLSTLEHGGRKSTGKVKDNRKKTQWCELRW